MAAAAPEVEDDITGTPDKEAVTPYAEGDSASADTPDLEHEGDAEELSPEEAEKFMRYMKKCKYGKSKHGVAYMKAHAAKYGLEMPGALNGTLPDDGAKKPEEQVQMGRDELPVQYAMELKKLRGEVKLLKAANDYRDQSYNRTMARQVVNELVLKDKCDIKDPAGEIARMTKLDDKGRAERAQEIRVNYAKLEGSDAEDWDLKALTARGMIPSYDGPIEGGQGDDKTAAPSQETIDECIHYCEEKHLDTSREGVWDKAMEFVQAARKASGKK